MNLLVIKPVSHISPSAFQMRARCQNLFYLLRMAGFPYVKTKQTVAMAYGLAVDAFIKDYIAKKIGNKSPHLDLTTNLDEIDLVDPKVCRDSLIQEARKIAVRYIELGFVEGLLDQRLMIEADIYSHAVMPISGKIDLVVNDIPFEWKLRGFGSDKKCTPTNGYIYGKHSDGEPLMEVPAASIEQTNVPWAIQLVFYNWLLNPHRSHTVNRYKIHEIVKNPDVDGGFSVAVHDGTIPELFASDLWDQVMAMWQEINGLETSVEEPNPGEYKCFAYGNRCPVADKCKAFQDWAKNKLAYKEHPTGVTVYAN